MPPRFLALGDSYTIGEAVDAAARWPSRICARLLLERAIGPVRPEIIAMTGWSVLELNHAIDLARPAGAWDVVSLLIGVNDQYRGGSARAYGPAFRATLRRAAELAGGDASRVMVLSIPDYGYAPHGAARRVMISAALDAFNAESRAAARELGARYVDITECSRQARADWIAPDQLHPSAAQHEAWSGLIYPVFDAIVRQRPTARASALASARHHGDRRSTR